MHLMGEGQGRTDRDHGWLFEPTFNRAIKLRQADPRITSDAGALLLRAERTRFERKLRPIIAWA
jgi:hypothetical protein